MQQEASGQQTSNCLFDHVSLYKKWEAKTDISVVVGGVQNYFFFQKYSAPRLGWI